MTDTSSQENASSQITYRPWQQILYSPLLGSTLATLIFVIYALVSGLKDTNGSPLSSATTIINIITGVAIAIPVLWILFSILSIILSMGFGYVLLKIKNRFFWSEGLFWFVSFLLGLCLGILVAFYNYHIEHHLTKSILIVIAFSLGSLFNASFYSVLSGKVRKLF
jgi:hypothetical protein